MPPPTPMIDPNKPAPNPTITNRMKFSSKSIHVFNFQKIGIKVINQYHELFRVTY
jgi:hypothetical protein